MAFTASIARNEFTSIQDERKLGLFQAGEVRTRDHRRRHRSRVSDSFLFSVKRAVDVAGSGLALLFFAPLLISVSIAIKTTSRGPVLFSQYRYGRNNKRFRIYKFRTMYMRLGDRSGRQQTMRNDPRVTSVGRMLRNTSLDELPQLINVLKGDMSLVGPRPHVPGMLAGGLLYEELVPYYFQRHTVRPGITGLAQVNGFRGETVEAHHAVGRIDCDLEYIEKWSPWTDIKIIAKTCQREFLTGGGV